MSSALLFLTYKSLPFPLLLDHLKGSPPTAGPDRGGVPPTSAPKKAKMDHFYMQKSIRPNSPENYRKCDNLCPTPSLPIFIIPFPGSWKCFQKNCNGPILYAKLERPNSQETTGSRKQQETWTQHGSCCQILCAVCQCWGHWPTAMARMWVMLRHYTS